MLSGGSQVKTHNMNQLVKIVQQAKLVKDENGYNLCILFLFSQEE